MTVASKLVDYARGSLRVVTDAVLTSGAVALTFSLAVLVETGGNLARLMDVGLREVGLMSISSAVLGLVVAVSALLFSHRSSHIWTNGARELFVSFGDEFVSPSDRRPWVETISKRYVILNRNSVRKRTLGIDENFLQAIKRCHALVIFDKGEMSPDSIEEIRMALLLDKPVLLFSDKEGASWLRKNSPAWTSSFLIVREDLPDLAIESVPGEIAASLSFGDARDAGDPAPSAARDK